MPGEADAERTFVTIAVSDVADIVADLLGRELEPLHQRIADLERRPQLKYCGTWQSGRTYQVGELVTSAGSLWHSSGPTTERPGDGQTSWQLVAKRGKDGRDGAAGPVQR